MRRGGYLTVAATQEEQIVTMSRRHALPRRSPESQGISSRAVLDFVHAVESDITYLHSFMLLRHGCVVAEGWWRPYGPRLPHLMFSLTKSFTSTAIGMAVAEGLLSIDDRVADFFPGALPADATEHARNMCVRHLLSMSTGHEYNTSDAVMHAPDGNHAKGFFSVPVVHPPGTHFLYNTGASHMLGVILHTLTGKSLPEYLEPRLFAPLGITPGPWMAMETGIHTGGSGSSFRTEDIARLGQLYLQRGRWRRTQLLSDEWVAQATSKHIDNGADPKSDWAQGYGFQFWRCRHHVFRGDGAFGQYCVVMPQQDAVLAMTGGMGDMQKPLDLVWDLLLPAMQPAELPEDPVALGALDEKLASLTLEPVQGTRRGPSGVCGRPYRLSANDLGYTSCTLSVRGKTATLVLDGGVEPTALRFGHGTWLKGQAVIGRKPERRPVAGSFAWTAPDTWRGELWGYTTPYRYTYECRFEGDSLHMDLGQNVGFGQRRGTTLEGAAEEAR